MKWRNGDFVENVLIVLRNVMTVGMDGGRGGWGVREVLVVVVVVAMRLSNLILVQL